MADMTKQEGLLRLLWRQDRYDETALETKNFISDITEARHSWRDCQKWESELTSWCSSKLAESPYRRIVDGNPTAIGVSAGVM
jgi:hypothetical protein